MPESSQTLAQKVADELHRRAHRLVLAESCTCGLIAATLGQIPGISAVFCGSSVVYRDDTKQQWLDVPAEVLNQHSSVSAQASSAIAGAVLELTPEATIAMGITGHLGPDAQADQDGTIYLDVWCREGASVRSIASETKRLGANDRIGRQQEATRVALDALAKAMSALG